VTGAEARYWKSVFALLLALGCDRGTPVPVAREAERDASRVVSLTPLATRFAIAIGARSRLVAVDAVSARLSATAGLPVSDLPGAVTLEPDLVLVPESPDPADPAVAALVRRGARVVQFAPHSFEDVSVLVRDVGRDLAGPDEASRFEAEFSRPLAKIGGESGGRPRPRVVAVVSFDPLVIAGGHSFETDLIEIAGGHSVTHPGAEPRLAISADRWQELAPDLVLVVAERPASLAAQQAVRNALPASAEVAFFPFDPTFWLDASVEPAQRLRAVIEPLSRRR
jgi:ABC-type Fe3+-hydroxamate transport system substrate-binding protein